MAFKILACFFCPPGLHTRWLARGFYKLEYLILNEDFPKPIQDAMIIRQRSFPLTTAAGHGDPLRVRAPQRGGKRSVGQPQLLTTGVAPEEAVVVDLPDEEICDISAGYEA